MECMAQEPVLFEDILCQIIDMIGPEVRLFLISAFLKTGLFPSVFTVYMKMLFHSSSLSINTFFFCTCSFPVFQQQLPSFLVGDCVAATQHQGNRSLCVFLLHESCIGKCACRQFFMYFSPDTLVGYGFSVVESEFVFAE